LGLDSSARPEDGARPRVASIPRRAGGTDYVETLEKQLDNPQVLQAKLDDPRKQVDLGVVAAWCWLRAGISAPLIWSAGACSRFSGGRGVWECDKRSRK